MRGNPGGVLESAVSVADEFLEEGIIVRADGRTPEARFEMDASAGDLLAGRPIVVLVDGGSASGSEIVAGALRDHRRATLMGERTFGKGSVQTVIPLRDGQALKLTTSKYFTPSGTSIHDKGIEPDIVIAGPDASTERPELPALPTQCRPQRTRRCSPPCSICGTEGFGAQYAAVRPPCRSASPAPTIAPISIAMIGSALSPKPALRPAGIRDVAAQVNQPPDAIDEAQCSSPAGTYITREQPHGRQHHDEQLQRILLHAEIALEDRRCR